MIHDFFLLLIMSLDDLLLNILKCYRTMMRQFEYRILVIERKFRILSSSIFMYYQNFGLRCDYIVIFGYFFSIDSYIFFWQIPFLDWNAEIKAIITDV